MVDQGYLDALDAWGGSRGKSAVDHLKSYAGELVDLLGQTNFYYHNTENDTLVVVQGIGLQYGFGETFDKADVDIKEQNKTRPGGKPFVQVLHKKAREGHEEKPPEISSRIEVFHGFKRRSKKKRKQFLEDIQKRGFIELTEAVRAALANGGRGQSGGTEAPSTPHDSTASQRFNPSGNTPQSEEAVGSGHSGHGGTVSPPDGGREAGGRADAEGSVAGTGSSDNGASGRVDASAPAENATEGEERVLRQGAKGSIRFKDTEKERQERLYEITLNPESDETTFIHEISHLFLEQFAHVARQENAPKAVKDEFAHLAASFNFHEEGPISEKAHERFAEAMTDYLVHGVAPKEGLGKAFDRAKNDFIRPVFFGTKRMDGVKINENIESFFDSLFMVDDAIKQAAKKVTDPPLMRQLLGLNVDQWVAYLNHIQDEIKDKTRYKEIAELRAKMQRVDKEGREKIKEVYKAKLDELTKNPGFELSEEFRKKNIFVYTPDVHKHFAPLGKTLPTGIRRFVSMFGVPYDDLVRLYPQILSDFGSPEALFKALNDAPESKAEAERIADEYTKKTLGKEFYDALNAELTTIGEALKNIEFSPEMMKRHMDEIVALGKNAGINKERIEQLEKAAQLYARSLPYSKLSMGQWRQRERRAAENVLRALNVSKTGRSGFNYKQAYAHKEEQVFAMHVVNEIYEIQRKASRYEGFLKRISDDDHLKKVGHLDQGEDLKNSGRFYDVVATLLEAMSLKKPPEDPEQIKARSGLDSIPKALDELNARRERHLDLSAAVNDESVLPPNVIKDMNVPVLQNIINNPRSFRDLTFNEQKEAYSFIRQVYYLKTQGRLVGLGDKVLSLKEVADLFDKEVPKSDEPLKILVDKSQQTPLENVFDVILNYKFRLTTARRILKMAGKPGEMIYELMARASGEKNKLGKKILPQLNKLLDISKQPGLKRALEKYTLPDSFGLPAGVDRARLGRSWLLFMALNVGNDSNMKRLVDGFGGEEAGWTAENVMALLDEELSLEEWKWVQSMWDLFTRELEPRLAEEFQSVNGIPMGRVVPRPFKTRHGTMRGGYYPIFYDRNLSAAGALQKLDEDGAFMHGMKGLHVTVAQGFTKGRVDSVYNSPLDLNQTQLNAAIAGMVHYITHERAVRDISRILKHTKTRAILTTRMGPKWVDYVEDVILRDFALGATPVDTPKILAAAQRAYYPAVLGFSLPPALGDAVRPLLAAITGKVKTTSILRAFLSPRRAVELAAVRSDRYGVMADNAADRYHSSREQSQLGGGISKVGWIRRGLNSTVFLFLDQSTKHIGAIIWSAKYDEALSSGMSEKEALRAADDLNDLLMPPVVDWAKPGLLNTPIGKLAAVFTIESLVYGNILGELAGESFAALKKGDPVKALEMALRLGAYVLTFSTMGALLMGQGPDEEEDIEDWVARQVITGLMGVDPFFLRLANAHFVQPTLFGKKSGTINVPVLETVEMVSSGASDLVTQLVKTVQGEKELDWENFSPAIDTIGPFVNAPVHVLRRFLDAHLSNKNGIDSVPFFESPLGSLEAFVYGRKKSRGWNLFRLAIEKEE